VTPDTRRLQLCLLFSLLVNAGVWTSLAHIWKGTPPLLAAPLHARAVRMVRLPPPVPVPPPTPVVVPPPPVPPPPVAHPKPAPKPKPKKLRRPGTRVHSSAPAPPAKAAGGSDAGAPAPASAPPAAPPPPVMASQKSSPWLVHNPVVVPPLSAIVTAGQYAARPTPPAPKVADAGNGAGGSASGKGAGAGQGTGTGPGAGSGSSADAGEPFGVGKGLSGDGAPRHIVYVLDISGSMTSRIDRAQAELRQAIHGLRPDETFNIIAFSDDARSFDTGMAPATPSLVRKASDYLDTLRVGGGTDLEAAMRLALSLPDVNEIVVLTDGIPTEGEDNFSALAREIRRRNVNHARISTIGLVGKNPNGGNDEYRDTFEAAALLRQIARDSGGASKLVTLGTAEP